MDWSYFILALLFVVVVIPAWMRLHYRSRLKAEESLGADERRELEALRRHAARLEDRLATLERVVEAERPGRRA
jgi:phage shock protein B